MKEIACLFLVIAIGYLIGRIRIKNVGLGISAVLLVALVFGHFGFSVTGTIKNFSLACFVCAVGLLSGPTFFENLKSKAHYYILIGICMVLVASIVCVLSLKLFKLPISLALGLLAGALSSTPCLAMALEVSKDTLCSIGYGIAYPFGVVGVVLAVQFISKLSNNNHTNIEQENVVEKRNENLLRIDEKGLSTYALALCLGIALGMIEIVLPLGIHFTLGISGGVLLSGLIVGSVDKISNLSIKMDRRTLTSLREFGLAIFLACAGMEAGSGFIKTINEYGIILFLAGVFMTSCPIATGYLMSRFVFKLDNSTTLGCICGSMTSTSALGSLAELKDHDHISSAYAATYSIGMIGIIVAVQVIYKLFA